MVGNWPYWNIQKMYLEGLKKGVHKQKSLNMIQALQRKPDEDISELLERIYRAYRKHSDADWQAPENVQMVNMTLTG